MRQVTKIRAKINKENRPFPFMITLGSLGKVLCTFRELIMVHMQRK